MITRYFIAAALLLASATASASPKVSNGTISWTGSDWYQVQRVSHGSIVNVCEGGQSCAVSPGNYTVINLSSGARYENIKVSASSAGASPIVVTGNSISWPNDGWYQVQRVSNRTIANVCEGGLSCSVTPGNYTVINLSSGKRYENIVVNASGGGVSDITVSDGFISWPNDGWYQVQSSTTFKTVCEGGLSCEVSNGSFHVINLTTGMRWENVIVGDTSAATTVAVDFDINVPAYKSNELQVRLSWGNINVTAAWVRDETWAIKKSLPANTENVLKVTFFDRNGAITLGSVERNFKTGTRATQHIRINASEFNTHRWDNDNDGVSNLNELIAGSNPDGNDSLQAVQANLELVPDKTFRFTWQRSANAQFYRVLENRDGVSGYSQIGNDIPASQRVYEHRVALYKRVNARYIVQACNSQSCADSLELTVPDSLSPAVGYLKATTDDPNGFGWDLALSADGSTMAVSDRAAIYVFARENGVWKQEARFKMSAIAALRFDDYLLTLSGNGDVLAVGTPEERLFRAEGEAFQNRFRDAGAVFLYHRENGQWINQGRLNYSDDDAGHAFGTAVDLSTDGNTLAVSARGASFVVDGETQYGGVYFFEQKHGQWQQRSHIVVYADTLSFSYDGTTLAIGDSSNATVGGSAYVYSKTGNEWVQQAFIKTDDARMHDQFGASITIDATGSTLAVGAPYWNFPTSSYDGPVGATYVFSKVDGNWQQDIRLNGSWLGDTFGRDVALSGDGKTLMVASEGSSNNGVGLVHVYARDNNTWFEQTRIEASNADSRDRFAHALELSNDGETLVVTAPGEESSAQGFNGNQEDNSGGNTGAVYLF